ncbi:MAG: hypothetical protein EON88_13435 [Brevundimonas sp.]|nr:MAG: hypothetical protein EON88_13435 [Brevundimonas sp.]
MKAGVGLVMETTMEDLFRSYWWIIFPIFGLAMGSWHSFAQFRNQQKKLDIIKAYAMRGEQPPAALLESLGRSEANEYGNGKPTNYWSLVGLFGVMTAGFGYMAYFTAIDGSGFAFGLVAMVMGAVAVWALICALMQRRDPR